MILRVFSILLISITAVGATVDDTLGYLSALSDFLESHKLGDTELNRILEGCDKGEMVNPILQSAADINPITQVYREALQSWITPGKLNATAVCEYAKSRLSDEARQKEEKKRAKENTVGIFDPASILSAANDYTCAIQHDNQVICWGKNIFGAHRAPNGLRAKSVVAGPNMACAIQLDDTFTCWGDIPYGTRTRDTLGLVRSIEIGIRHTCAVELDNTLVCWGSNHKLQLNAPANLGAVQSISAGYNHTCAITQKKTLVCWGSNDDGQLNVPSTLKRVKSVSAHGNHTCAIDSDDILSCWGSEFFGGYTAPHDLGQVTFVAAGAWRACAKKMDGTFVCWKDSGIDAQNIGPYKSVAIGTSHACGVELNDSVRCWNLENLTPIWSLEGLKVLSTEATP